jgi:Ca-activated chloride channel family protein
VVLGALLLPWLAAAQELAQRDDAESLYNRGNALAKLGRFDEALEAYGRALERAPGHADAKYNKSLIEDLLRQQEQSEQPPEKQREDDSARDEQGGEDGQGQGEGEARQGQAGERESDMTPPSESGDEASKEQDSDAESGQSEASQQDTAKGSAGNAATDELAGEDREAEQAEARNDAAGQHEEALAAEQWLRQVPDDPGGLWRRKFRYQYQQKYGGQSGSAEPW